MRRVIVCAHPDDEALWCGGLPIRYREDDWTIICCSIPERDPIRAYKFFDACEALGARGALLPISEKFFTLSWLDLDSYDHIITHNANGEYGHPHHRLVHSHIKHKWGHKPITTIGYNGEVNQTVELNAQEVEQKLQALKKYDHCLPYETGNVPKWEALLHRYCTKGGLDFATETYGGSPL